jgi:hypothetical protein
MSHNGLSWPTDRPFRITPSSPSQLERVDNRDLYRFIAKPI